MKFLKPIWRVLTRGCAITAVVTLVMFLAVSVASSYDSIRVGQYLLIFAFSMLIALSMELFGIRRLPIMIRILIQYIALLISFLVLFLSSGNIKSNAASIIIFTFAFTLVYAVICGILFPLLRAFGYYEKNLSFKPQGKDESKPTTYQSRFS